MPERSQDSPDRKAQSLADQVFSLVDGYKRRIIQARTEQERDGLKTQISGELVKVRKFVVGPERKKLNPHVADRLTGEYALKATRLEEAVLESGLVDVSLSAPMETLKNSILPISKTKESALKMRMAAYLNKLHGISEARGKTIDPAWLVFFYEAGMKRMAIPNFDADEWYGEVLSGKSEISQKLVLPIVVVDQIEKSAREAAKAMPDHDTFMECRHRALNALDELIGLWEKDMPAVADKYQMVKQVLDREIMTLSLYHRYEGR